MTIRGYFSKPKAVREKKKTFCESLHCTVQIFLFPNLYEIGGKVMEVYFISNRNLLSHLLFIIVRLYVRTFLRYTTTVLMQSKSCSPSFFKPLVHASLNSLFKN
jgi:hypothetical protein